MKSNYRPIPIAVEYMELPTDLAALVERLAENAHDLWSEQRLKEEWTWGPERCDRTLKHPCLIPYSELPEREKAYDRRAVLGTVKAIVASGYKISRIH